jgi:hypothetical protein
VSSTSTAIQSGYVSLARTVIQIALDDLKTDTALRNEAIFFFENGSHFSLFCEVGEIDQKRIYALYESILQSNE